MNIKRSLATNAIVSSWGADLTLENTGRAASIRRMLERLGWQLLKFEDKSATAYIAFEHSKKNLQNFGQRVPRDRRILVVSEPPAVRPDEYRQKMHEFYGAIIYISPLHFSGPSDLFWKPGFVTEAHLNFQSRVTTQVRKPKSIGFINENKFSFVPGNLYKFRKQVLNLLVGNEFDISIAGRHWERGWLWTISRQFKAFLFCMACGQIPDLRMFSAPLRRATKDRSLGCVEDGLRFLSSYEFALVIENDPTYLSEKLFNAIAAGCVPIYIGAPLAAFELPHNLAFECSASSKSILEAISGLSDIQKNLILKTGEEFLIREQKSHTATWSLGHGWQRLESVLSRF